MYGIALFSIIFVYTDAHHAHWWHTPAHEYAGSWRSEDGRYSATVTAGKRFVLSSNLPNPNESYIHLSYDRFHVYKTKDGARSTYILRGGDTMNVITHEGKLITLYRSGTEPRQGGHSKGTGE